MRDVAEVRHQGAITTAIAREALDLLEVDSEGLESTDRELLRAIAFKFEGGPVGLSTLAVTLGGARHDRGSPTSRTCSSSASFSARRAAGC